MKNIINKIHIHDFTYILLLLCFISGFIKNILIIFFICIIHEFGHVILIKMFNYEILKIEIYPFGGFTYINKLINTSIKKDIIISCGGVLMQMILFLLVSIFRKYISLYTYELFVYYNTVLLIFNLLPIIPLDGSKIINLFLDKYYSFSKSYYINGVISIISLFIFGIINYIYNYDNYFIIMYLGFQSVVYIKNYKYIFNKYLLERYLYDCNYNMIKYKTKSLKDLKKETFHYFEDNKMLVNEKKKLAELFDKATNF